MCLFPEQIATKLICSNYLQQAEENTYLSNGRWDKGRQGNFQVCWISSLTLVQFNSLHSTC